MKDTVKVVDVQEERVNASFFTEQVLEEIKTSSSFDFVLVVLRDAITKSTATKTNKEKALKAVGASTTLQKLQFIAYNFYLANEGKAVLK